MVRTQIYLTEEERAALRRLAEARGTTQSALIREAVDQVIEAAQEESRLARLRAARGIWADRDDLPNPRELRRGASRRIPPLEDASDG